MKNLNKTGRFFAIDNCLKTGLYCDWGKLADACEQSPQVGYPPSQGLIKKDISEMRRDYDAPIIYDRMQKKYYYEDKTFSITKHGFIKKHADLLKEAQLILSQFPFLPQLDGLNDVIEVMENKAGLKGLENRKVISFDNAVATGTNYLKVLYQSTIEGKVVDFYYYPFHFEKKIKVKIHPYYIKEYNKRWFLIGLNNDSQKMETFGLDRIVSEIDVNESTKYVATVINFDEYFNDIIGVTKYDLQRETIRFSISSNRANYIKTKKIHHTQEIISDSHTECIFEITVIPNNELTALLLSFGSDLRIIKPDSLINKMKEISSKMISVYGSQN